MLRYELDIFWRQDPPVGNADAPNLVCAVTQKKNPVRPMMAGVRLP
jgi:hypothetical protein